MSQDQKTSVFQADEGVKTIQPGLNESLQALAVAFGQVAGQTLRFAQRTEAKNSRIHRDAGLGLLLKGGQDIADDPVDRGGGDALLADPLALISL